MSRKKRAEKRQERAEQQKQMMIVGGVILAIAIVIIAMGLVYGYSQESKRNENATATAATYYGQQTEVANETLTPQEDSDTSATLIAQATSAQETQVADMVAYRTQVAEAAHPRQTALAPVPDEQIAAAAAQIEDGGEFEPVIIPLEEMPQWDAPPEMSIDPDATYLATFVTEKGPVVVELFAAESPLAVNNFVFLAREGYYNNTTFHRVIEGFMAQGGDPSGTGSGSPGYMFADEFDNGLSFDRPGLLAMAKPDRPDSNGGQFFITYNIPDWLNGKHTIFGQVVEGFDVLHSLTLRNPQMSPDFDGDTIITIEITEIPAEE